jgi:hypothetical protein
MTTAAVVIIMLTALLVASPLSTAAAAGPCDVDKDLLIWQSLGEPQMDGSAEYSTGLP